MSRLQFTRKCGIIVGDETEQRVFGTGFFLPKTQLNKSALAQKCRSGELLVQATVPPL